LWPVGTFVDFEHSLNAAVKRLRAALELLKKAFAERDPALTNVGVDPRFEPLRRDHRYVELLAHIGIPANRS
jgi:hypothetical protein